MYFHNQDEAVGLTQISNASWLLPACVVVSLLAHGSTLLFATESVMQISEPKFGRTIIHAVLSPAGNEPATPPAPSINDEADAVALQKIVSTQRIAASTPITNGTSRDALHQRTRDITLNPAIQTRPVMPATVLPVAAEPPASTTATGPIESDALSKQESPSRQLKQQRNYLLGELKNQLSQYLTYPRQAQRHGWQGEVMVAFYVDAHGRLHNIRLTQSSGHAILDHSAISAIGKLVTVSLPGRLGQMQAMEMQLPVIYRLRES